MTSGVGPGEKNFFYIGDGYSSNSVDYGLINLAAFIAQGYTQSIYYDACDENSWETVEFRYPLSNSCGQPKRNYQDEICKGSDEGMECVVDLEMEIRGVTHALWVGAPHPMSCGNRQVGYWDHITGLEELKPPFMNEGPDGDAVRRKVKEHEFMNFCLLYLFCFQSQYHTLFFSLYFQRY